MATLHTSGTQLAVLLKPLPLNKAFLAVLGSAFLLAMHFFMPNPGGSGLSLSFNPATWIPITIAIAIGFYQLANNRQVRYSKVTIGLFISCLMLTLPLLYPSSEFTLTANRLIGLWAGFCLFLVLQQFQFSNNQKQRLLWFILLATVIQAALGYTQYFILEPDNILGYNTQANRPYGIFQQPNVMASFLATGLVISAYLLARQAHKYNYKLSKVSLLYTVPLITLPLLILLASRTGWLGALLGTACITPYLYRFSTSKRFFGWITSALIGLILGLSLAGGTESSGVAAEKLDLDSPRAYIFPQALDMLIEKPFTGYGYGRFEAEYTLYTAHQHQLNSDYNPGLPSMDHPHNELLYWGVEGGILPILGIFGAALLILSRLKVANKGTRLAMFALFIPIVLHSQLEYPFYHSAIHWVTFIILIYWVDQRVSKYSTKSFSSLSKTLLRVLSLVLPILVSIYMISSLHTNYVLTKFEQSKPKNPDLLDQISNPLVWKDRLDWDIYSTYLNIGLYTADPKLIQPYIEWSLGIIKNKPRPAFYSNLILAYQGLGDSSRAEQIRKEAEFLFPNKDFSQIQYRKALPKEISSTQ